VQPDGRDGKLRISDTAWAVQGNLAMMIEPSDRTRIGIRWLSETDLDFKDSPDLSGPDLPNLPGLGLDGIDLGITMPQTLNIGVHHQWNDNFALLGSVGWEEFSQFGRIQVGVDDTGVGTTLEEDFRDVWSVGFGAEYKLRPDWELTAGFNFDSSMSSDRTRPIVIPLGKMYRYGVGFKHQRPSGRTLNGGLSWIYEGNLGIPENNGVDVTYTNVSIWVASLSVSF
jgi:long-chain fatty acid transport protein